MRDAVHPADLSFGQLGEWYHHVCQNHPSDSQERALFEQPLLSEEQRADLLKQAARTVEQLDVLAFAPGRLSNDEAFLFVSRAIALKKTLSYLSDILE